MNALVFSPSLRKIACSYFSTESRHSRFAWSRRGNFTEPSAIREMLDQALADSCALGGVDVVGVRLPYGGDRFTGPALADSATMAEVEALSDQAPLHLPAAAMLVEELHRRLGAVPVTLSFETAFFTQLPAREYLYGMESSPRDRLALRRFGYHGLYHEAACRHVGRLRGGAGGSGCRVASLCLEAQPELTAVVGSRPLTVTSGATPLEGLPGQTTCGELDPSIVLAMSSRLHLGAEQVNEILTRRSGIAALAGKPVSLESVLDPSSPHRLARDVLRYRILQSCGAAIAAMGGLDAIVFSGQYAQSGRTLGPWLLRKLAACCDDAATAGCEVLDVELHRIVADEAHCAVAEQNACHGAGRPAAVA